MAEQLPRVQRGISTLALAVYALLLAGFQVLAALALWQLARDGRPWLFLLALAAYSLLVRELGDIWPVWRRRWPTWTRTPWMRDNDAGR